MTPNLKKLLTFILPLVFIPYVLICLYNNPNADDFLCAAEGRTGDLLSTWLKQYQVVGGRYTTNFMVLVGPLTYNAFLLYKFIPLLLIVIHWFSIKSLLKNLIGKYVSRVDLHIYTYLLVFLFIYQMPIISEVLYWYTGAVVYLLGCLVATWYITLLLKFWQNQFILKNRFIHIGAITVLIIVTTGFNEVLMLMMNIFAIMLAFIVFLNKLSHKWVTVYLIGITLVASLMVVLAPGNLVRGSQYTQGHHFSHSFLWSLLQTIRFSATWIFSAPLWIISLGFYFLHKKNLAAHPLFSKSFYLNPFISTSLLFLVIFISVFPAYWATGILGQHRTLNVAYYFFIFLWFINLTVWFNRFKINIPEPNKKMSFVFLLVLLGCFIFLKNGYDCSMDLITGRAKNYDVQMKERYALMKSANDTIEFTPIKNPPKSLSFYEVTYDPNSWLNTCWVTYFGREGEVVVIRKK